MTLSPKGRPLQRAAFPLIVAGHRSPGDPRCHSPAAPSSRPPHSRQPERAKPAAKKVAVLTSVYRYLSHSYHIAGRFLDGYMKGDEHHFPDFGVASAYVEQKKKGADLSAELAEEHSFRLSESIEDALTLGGDKLAVDGVLLSCEH